MEVITFNIPDFVRNHEHSTFLLPAKDQSNFWKFYPNSYKCVNSKIVYHLILVVNGEVKVDSKLINKINFEADPVKNWNYDYENSTWI